MRLLIIFAASAFIWAMGVPSMAAQFPGIRIGKSHKSAKDQPPPVLDLGQREAGGQYPLRLVAVNLDCNSPQDFRFKVGSIPWLSVPGDDVVHGLGPGQSGSIQGQLDFTGINRVIIRDLWSSNAKPAKA